MYCITFGKRALRTVWADTETTKTKAAYDYLTKVFEKQHQRPPNNLRIRILWQFGCDGPYSAPALDPSDMQNSLIKNILAAKAPVTILDWIQAKDVAIKDNECVAICFLYDQDDAPQPPIAVIMIGYREESPKESAKNNQRREKAAQAAAKRQATIEAKEKALLEKLKVKYGEV